MALLAGWHRAGAAWPAWARVVWWTIGLPLALVCLGAALPHGRRRTGAFVGAGSVAVLGGLALLAGLGGGGGADEVVTAGSAPSSASVPSAAPETTPAATTTSTSTTTPITVPTTTTPATTTMTTLPTTLPPPTTLALTDSRDALEVLATIPVAREHPDGYDRGLFQEGNDADHDGCDTRNEVLGRDALAAAVGCPVTTGTWYSPYDGVTVSDRTAVQVDHVVALKEAWDSGAWAWTPEQRKAYANDLDDARTLRAVTASSNAAKGDKDPSNWVPIDADLCRYVGDWIAIKARWQLSMDESEWGRLKNLLTTGPCTGARVATWIPASVTLPPPPTTAAPAPPTPTEPSVIEPPITTEEPSANVDIVHPGAFCSPEGAVGVSKTGKAMVCGPAKDGRNRWHSP